MFLWRQEDTSSLRLFSVDSSGRQMIRNFSLRQRLHLLLELLYGECDERMRQEIKCSMLLSLRVQICLLSSVEFLCLAWRNDAVWLRCDTETTPHHSATLNTETPPNSASISGPSKTTTSNTLFPGAFSHRTRRTTAQAKDVTSASKKNS